MKSMLFDIDEEKINNQFGKRVDFSYSWSDMANALTDCRIPHTIVRDLPDLMMSMAMGRPLLNLYKFDDYLHEKYGDYESEGKSMRDMFNIIFGEKAEKMAYYFGVE